MFFVFCHLYLFSPSHHGSGWPLPVISLFLTYTESRVRACLSILSERCRGSPEDDEFCPLRILFLYYRQAEDGISTLYLFDDASSCDVDPGVDHHHDDERQVKDGISAQWKHTFTAYRFGDDSSYDVDLGVEPHHQI
jgi:hypothetical protein